MFLNDINQLQSVEWGRSYLWDVTFIQSGNEFKPSGEKSTDIPPAPFDTWFPATEVDEQVGSINSSTWQGPHFEIAIPKDSGSHTITLTFLDDKDNTLFEWFKHWYNNEVLNYGEYTATLAECCKLIQLVKLKPRDTNIVERVLDLGATFLPTNLLPYGSSIFQQPKTRGDIADSDPYGIYGDTPSGLTAYWVYPEGELVYKGTSAADIPTYTVTLRVVGKPDVPQKPNPNLPSVGERIEALASNFKNYIF